MKKSAKLLALLLAIVMVFSLGVPALAEGDTSMEGKTVILHSNDVHGAIMGYANMAALKADYESKGAEVILADAGDFSQGKVEVSSNKGLNAVSMMNAADYNVAAPGNHEFDYGYAQLKENLKSANFDTLCCNIVDADGKPVFEGSKIIEAGGVKVGFVGVNTPETQTKANPALISGLKWLAGTDMVKAVQAEVDSIKNTADVVIVLAHLGVDASSEPNRSTDLLKGLTDVDFVIDGHSHTVMDKGPNGEAIQSTGTAFENIGVIVIDNAEKKIVSNELVPVSDTSAKDETVAAAAQAIIDAINAEYDKVFAKSEVNLVGDRTYNEETGLYGNRDGETNLGNLITDSMVWKIQQLGGVTVDDANIVALTNGGGIRAPIAAGDITKKDVNTVLPFGNTIAVIYVTGAELLEALEASTYCSPETSIGGFPQVSGIEFTINAGVAYDAEAETYPNSTYYGPASINRVTIDSINGKAFDPAATYAVVTNNFTAAGGDTYYAFAAAKSQFDTGIPLDEALMEYITTELKGVIGDKYAQPEGRINYVYEPFTDIDGWWHDEICLAHMMGIVNGMTADQFMPGLNVTREQYVTMLWRIAGEEAPTDTALDFTDAGKVSSYAKNAVAWGVEAGLIEGYDDGSFKPQANVTRAEMATFTYRLLSAIPDTTDMVESYGFKDVPAGAYYEEAVNAMANLGIINGYSKTQFAPADNALRGQAAAILVRTVIVISEAVGE